METSERNSEIAWHSQSENDVIAILQSSQNGLSQAEAEQRLKQYGPNRLKPPQQRSAWVRFLLQFHNVLIYVLLISAVITGLLGHWIDTAVIMGVVVINALIGFIQEGKAEKALNAIRRMLSLDAIVVRDGKRLQIPAEELVPGDIVLLQSGHKVPADLRLLNVKSLRIEEAALTGESEAVEKKIEAVPSQVTIGDRLSMAYSSTLVVYGQGTGVVVATSDQTEIGRISTMLESVDTIETPLLRQVATFGHWLTWAIIALSVCMLLYGLLLGDYSLDEMFLAAVSIAVAAIPEGLPAIMTITLALGVQMMARRHAIIRRLPAVETLGAVTVICTDKTGTLTRNEMTVQRVIMADYQLEVSGVGYAPVGGFSLQDNEFLMNEHAEILDLFRAGLLCNDAQLREHADNWTIEGDPTEGALITLALKAGLDPQLEQESLPRTDAIPFESEHRFMATLHHDHTGNGYIYLKGAPEEVLAICVSERSIGTDRPLDNSYWQAKMQEAAASGQRILAIAVKAAEGGQTTLNFNHVRTNFTLLGLVGIIDPPKEEAIEAVQRCRSAGIRVKMITGDHIATARAIGKQLGIGDGQTALSGIDLDRMDDAQLRKEVTQTDIFARASPEHKLRLVQALQANDEVVAMTGDGVNDAPALKRADIGVAMGKKGTEVAKEAAKMVITDDNFVSIAHAVEEGRTVYDNIRKTIIYIMPTSVAEAGMLVIAILLGITLPISPVQILWINMVTAVTLSISLAFEKAEPGIMQRPPRDPGEPILSRFMLWRIAFVSLLLTSGALGLFLWQQAQGGSIETCRTIAVNALVMGEIWYLFNCRYLLSPALSCKGLLGSSYVLLAVSILVVIQLLFTYSPLMQQLFGTAAIDTTAWIKIILFGVVIFLAVEIEKYLIARYQLARL
ncbi:cation-transporting P-type ATPase [Nitrosomonas communis]|uniref:cation-transporting P-type ATPase n=1 Tax=Nitrosomonas communis TaxID=44574 RepID=UPI0026F344D6|nr:cation-transporting P-type ATPase [Nitrosomonas communis]